MIEKRYRKSRTNADLISVYFILDGCTYQAATLKHLLEAKLLLVSVNLYKALQEVSITFTLDIHFRSLKALMRSTISRVGHLMIWTSLSIVCTVKMYHRLVEIKVPKVIH